MCADARKLKADGRPSVCGGSDRQFEIFGQEACFANALILRNARVDLQQRSTGVANYVFFPTYLATIRAEELRFIGGKVP